MRQANQIKRKIWSIRSEGEFYKSETRLDSIAIEEPLEIIECVMQIIEYHWKKKELLKIIDEQMGIMEHLQN